jgi:hypothetical protein
LATFRLQQFAAHGMLRQVVLQELAKFPFGFLEVRLVDPQRIVGVEGNDFDVHGVVVWLE